MRFEDVSFNSHFTPLSCLPMRGLHLWLRECLPHHHKPEHVLSVFYNGDGPTFKNWFTSYLTGPRAPSPLNPVPLTLPGLNLHEGFLSSVVTIVALISSNPLDAPNAAGFVVELYRPVHKILPFLTTFQMSAAAVSLSYSYFQGLFYGFSLFFTNFDATPISVSNQCPACSWSSLPDLSCDPALFP
jgi:hypothetical protein